VDAAGLWLEWDTHLKFALNLVCFADTRLVLEVANRTLADKLMMTPKLQRPDLIKLAHDLLKAMQHFETVGLVHGDVKPANIFQMVDPLTNDITWKLGDFDEARKVGERVKGFTAQFAAPEVVNGEPIPAQTSMDVWSFGLVVLAADGRPLFDKSQSDTEVIAELASDNLKARLISIKQASENDHSLTSALDAMLQIDPKQRKSAGGLLTGSLLTGGFTSSGRKHANAEIISEVQKVGAATNAEVRKVGAEIIAEVQKVGASVICNSSMLGALLQGEHDCPRWLVMLPKRKAKSSLTSEGWLKELKPNNWMNKTVILYFICPVTMCVVGDGFELKLPGSSTQDLMLKYGPALRVGMSLLTLAVRVSGLPIPNLSDIMGGTFDTVKDQMSFYEALSGGFAEELASIGLDGVNEWTTEKLLAEDMKSDSLEDMNPDTRRVVQQSYGHIRQLLDFVEPKKQDWDAKLRDTKRCGLVKAICTHEEGQPYEWVAPKWKPLFEKHGRQLLRKAPDRAKTEADDYAERRISEEQRQREEQREREAQREREDQRKREEKEAKEQRRREEKEAKDEKRYQRQLEEKTRLEDKKRRDKDAELEREIKRKAAEAEREIQLAKAAAVVPPPVTASNLPPQQQVIYREPPPQRMKRVKYWGTKTWCICLLSGGYLLPIICCCGPCDEREEPA